MKILIVDDNKLIRAILSRLFKPYGEVIDFVVSGEDAVSEFRKAAEEKNPYQIVSMDYALGSGINGLDAVGELRKVEKDFHFRSRIFMVSASADKELMLKASIACDGYLLKPITADKLRETLHDNGIYRLDESEPDPNDAPKELVAYRGASELERKVDFSMLEKVPVLVQKNDSFLIYARRHDPKTDTWNYVCTPAAEEPYFRNIRANTIIARIDTDDVPLSCGSGVAFLPKQKVLVALDGGQVVFEHNAVHIRNLLRVDVPICARCLSFPGKIIITGDIADGVVINAGGDLEIHGFAGNCKLYSGKNVFLSNINGKNEALVEAGGTIYALHAYQVQLNAKVGIRIKEEALNCTMKTRGDILAEKIIGGIAEAAGSIQVKEAGSRQEVRTLLAAGIDFEAVKKIRAQEAILARYHKVSGNTELMLGRHAKVCEDTCLLDQVDSRLKMFHTLGKYLCINAALIPEQEQVIQDLRNSMDVDPKATITIQEYAYKSVRLELGVQTYDFMENTNSFTFTQDKTEKNE